MAFVAIMANADDVRPWRVRHRAEANGQIVHDSLHQRDGWTRSYLLQADGVVVGFGSIATAGPWQDKPTVFEFYLRPESRGAAFHLFAALVAAAQPRYFEVQTSDGLLAVMLHTFGRDVVSEKIVFRDAFATALPAGGSSLRRVTSVELSRERFEARYGASEWVLECAGRDVGTGGIMFHYNPPYGDIYMEVNEGVRRRGLGAYFVQELKRIAYELGCIPGARCSPDNVASRLTLQKAGFVPFAHILLGQLR